ncbi:MAG: amino acid--tRNA ligase-related protein, partial [Patescibacteria group bacterium]
TIVRDLLSIGDATRFKIKEEEFLDSRIFLLFSIPLSVILLKICSLLELSMGNFTSEGVDVKSMGSARPGPITKPMEQKELLRLQALVMKSLREYMDERGFLETFHPGITQATGSCEAIANIFVLAERKFLTLSQTAQLYMEGLLIQSQLPRMFTSGRSFRREVENDGRHLNDFELFEWEALDIDLAKLVQYNNELVEHVIVRVLRSNILERERQRILYYWLDLWKDPMSPREITYHTAMTYLRNIEFTVPDLELGDEQVRLIQTGDDFDRKAEWKLTEHYGIVQVTHYPENIKFFNMERSRDQKSHPGCVECVDMLLPYAGETIGGSAREYDYKILKDKLYFSTMLQHLIALNCQRGGDADEIYGSFDAYLDLFKNEQYPRAGAGKGLGRVLQFLTASDSIIPF